MRNYTREKLRGRFLSLFTFHFSLFTALCSLSCISLKTQEEKLTPPRSTDEIRLDDIRKHIAQEPVKAIDLIGVYREVYRVTGEDGPAAELLELEKEATAELKNLLDKAVAEQRWDDAASYSRSLSCIEPQYDAVEPDYILALAKKKLEENDNLSAFLAAVHVHELRPLSFEDAALFLERAVQARQRRAAAYFFAAAQKAGSAAKIPASAAEYARGSDSVAAMINGVATVMVDRGIKIERGMGYADRILGSAFFIDSTGLLITNYHVIASEVDPKYEGYSRMYIRMGDSASPRIPARVIGYDKALDLALIKTEYKSEFVFSIVDRVVPQVGDTVIAIGSPGGLEKTVTSGIVSSLSRRFLQIGDVYQIDAAVNPGNSGGPVVDTSGRLVGIVFAGAEQYQGLNFAVPAQRLAAALPAMIKGGKAERPWLGIALSESSGSAEIIYTAPNTPASLHRVTEGSKLMTLNGQKITAPQSMLIPAMQDAIFQSRPGELVVLETQDSNGGIRKHLVMTVPRPDFPLVDAARLDSRERLAAPLFGLILSPTQGKSRSANYMVKKIVRGSIADEMSISSQDPVYIRGFRIYEKEGVALMEIEIKKRSMGYMETYMQLPARLDSPDTL
ncbi:MAG: trypsin-like peptidase domain-containing protein [Treponema sp.]|jgi:S1-C subfamily serine protease|nr:trypsin-like peptidase domain-containing protein [Treponema sp.]